MKLIKHKNGAIVQVIEEPGKPARNEIVVRLVYADDEMERVIFEAVKQEMERRQK